jgi:broad specificity phosphatase PhoE
MNRNRLRQIDPAAAVLACTLIGLQTVPQAVNGQQSSSHMPPNLTIFIVRHAEKPAQGDDLNPEGAARAQAYVKYLQDQVKYDGQPIRWNFLFASAESNKSNRPFLTLQPLAEAMHLEISDQFKNKHFNDLVEEIRNNHGNKFDNANVLICWHHGEILALASALGAEASNLPRSAHWPKKWDHHAYGWLLKIYYTADGSLDSQHTEAVNEKLMPDDTVPLP